MGVQYAMYECLRLASQYFALDDNVKLWDILSRNDLLLSSSNKSLGNRDLIAHNASKEVTISKDTLSHIGSVCESEYMAAWDEQTENDRNQISVLFSRLTVASMKSLSCYNRQTHVYFICLFRPICLMAKF